MRDGRPIHNQEPLRPEGVLRVAAQQGDHTLSQRAPIDTGPGFSRTSAPFFLSLIKPGMRKVEFYSGIHNLSGVCPRVRGVLAQDGGVESLVEPVGPSRAGVVD